MSQLALAVPGLAGAPGTAGPWLGILGPLRVLHQRGPVTLGPRKQQVALAVLLGHANSVVSVDTLVDAVWDETPPRTARKNLQVYMSGLRRLLGQARLAPRIIRQGHGYTLEIDPADLDWLVFERIVRDSRRLWQRADPAALARALDGALALWRGPVLDGLHGGPVIDGLAQRLEASYLTTFEDWAEAEVAAGGALGAVDRISGLARQHPFRERLRMLQMTALSQIGRRTEALGVFDEVRRGLAREFGLAPGAALAGLHQALLRDGQVADPRPPGEAVRRLASFSLLPRDLPCFTGREPATWELTGAFAAGERLAVLSGPVGAGKTALAVHAAHQLREQFPDGCFFARLRAPDGTARPLPEIVAGLWWAVPESAVGGAADAAEWQRWLATHRALVVLDDARREAEVRPLLPEAGDSAVIVTSWSRLTGLGPACRLPVPPLDLAQAVGLLGRIIGPGRVGRDPVAAGRVVVAAGLLPLGVRAAGDKLAALGHLPLAEYAARAGQAAALLDEPAVGEVTVRARLAQAARALPGAARAALPGLGRLPEPSFTLAAAAAALGLAEGAALRVLEILVEASILTVPGGEVVAHDVRYEMPALARAYARELPTARP
jgi:DNA-binding SARP family transcriptional activator